MDKQALVAVIVKKLESEVAALKAAALETYSAATGEESKAENKYDTRALEASYLAGAQAKRVLDLETTLGVFRRLEPKSFGSQDRIESTALVDLDLDEKSIRVFIAPVKESLTVHHAGALIQVITPQSPLGQALLGRRVGETAKIEKGPKPLEYEIVTIE